LNVQIKGSETVMNMNLHQGLSATSRGRTEKWKQTSTHS